MDFHTAVSRGCHTGLVPVPLAEQVQQERALKEARHAASAAIGHIIAMGEDTMHFYEFEQKVLPYVQSRLPGVHYRAQNVTLWC